MPNVIRILSPYIPNGNPASMFVQIQSADPFSVDSGVYAPGQIGQSFDLNDKTWEFVILKAGDTIAPGNALYWNDRSKGIVSVASASSDGGVNDIAGVAQATGTAGANGALICAQCGGAASLLVSAQPAGAGAKVIGSATSGKFAPVAAGTAPTDNVYGVFTGAGAAGSAPAVVNIPTLP